MELELPPLVKPLKPHATLSMRLLVLVFLVITFLQYAEHLGHPAFLANLTENLGLTRYTVERILYLVPMIWASVLLGRRGGVIVSLAAVICMLPRAIFDSPRPEDALVETVAVFIVGNLTGVSLESLKKERERRAELEDAQAELTSQLQVIESQLQVIAEDEKRLKALNNTAEIISQSLQLGQVLHSAVSCVKDVMAVEAVRIYILDEDAAEIELAAYEGVSEEFARNVCRLRLGEGFNGRVAQSGEVSFVEDASKETTLTSPVVKEENIRSQVIVPMMAKGKVVGTIAAAMHSYREFLMAEVDLLKAIANQVGVAVDNARLYLQEKETSEQLRVSEEKYRELFENANDAIWLNDLQGNIITVNGACARLTGYSVEELYDLRAANFLSHGSLMIVRDLEERLLRGMTGSRGDVKLIKKDGNEAFVQLACSLVYENGRPIAFQHIARDVTDEKRLQENLRFLVQQSNRAQEEERKRIAQELHDDTVQSLIVHCQEIDYIATGIKGLPQKAREHLEELHQGANSIMQEVRRLSQDLRPAALDTLGLVPALRWLASSAAGYSGVDIKVTVVGKERKLPEETELVIFRIAQEALRNVWKHAQTASAEVILEFSSGGTRITVADKGRGFSLPRDIGNLARDSKLGLAGMQERAQLVGGTLKVFSEPGGGTTLVAELPL